MARPGRKSKGPRRAMHVRVPVDHYAAYEAVAAESGMPLADWVALTLARSQDLPEPSYVHRSSGAPQGELPLGA